jgi:hypothetical protein
MKLSSYISTIALVAAGFAATANAATITSATGELVLGFQATGGFGAASNLEVDLGSYSSYSTAFGNSQTFVVAELGADLTATYGADWNTRTDITWSFAGTLGTTTRQVYISKVESIVGTQSTPQLTSTFSNGDLANSAGNIGYGTSGLNGKSSTTNSDLVAIIDASNGLSYSTSYGSDGKAYAIFEKVDVSNTTLLSGADYAVSDLYKLSANVSNTNKSVTYTGSFALDANGTLTYSYSAASFSAVPEPATYSAIAGAAVLGLVAFRRRRQTKA